MDKSKILAAFESVSFPEFGIKGMKAKIDTGALSGALHCTKIQEIKTPGGKELRFAPFDHPEVEIVSREFTIGYVRSSNGQNQKRYFITTEIVIRGESYPLLLSLADRTEMKWPVLIGRRFLRQNGFLVDVRQSAKYRDSVKE